VQQKPDWKALIVKMSYWKQLINDNDREGAIPWHLPKIAATEGEVLRAESDSNIKLPEEYKSFLCCANGWAGFYISTDLFGVDELINAYAADPLPMPEVREFIETIDLDAQHVIPIGASRFDQDVFLLVSPSSPVAPNHVIWWAGEEVERYVTFEEFFNAMIAYNAQIARKLMPA
jgi:hypothetical protein